MSFPRISEAVADFVEAESLCGAKCNERSEKRKKRVLAEFRRITSKNDAIGLFLTRVGFIPAYRENPTLLLHLYGYAVDVYRLVEEETKRQGLKMPVVAEEVGAPIQEEIFRDPQLFFEQGVRAVYTDNPIIMAIAHTWMNPFQENPDAIRMFGEIGYCLYCFFKGQWEADELKAQFEP